MVPPTVLKLSNFKKLVKENVKLITVILKTLMTEFYCNSLF